MLSLQPWLIIELSPAVLGRTCLWQCRDCVQIMSVKGVSTTFGLASGKMHGPREDIKLSSNYWPPVYAKIVATPSLPCPKNERQWSVNDFWLCMVENSMGVRWHWPINERSAVFLGRNAYNKIVTMSQNECERSINRASKIVALASWII